MSTENLSEKEKLPEIEKSALEGDEVKSLEFNDELESPEKTNEVAKPTISFGRTVLCLSCYGGCGTTLSPYNLASLFKLWHYFISL